MRITLCQIGEQMQLLSQLRDQLLGLGAGLEAAGDIVRGRSQQDVAYADTVGRTKALGVLLEIATTIVLARHTVLHLLLEQALDLQFLIRMDAVALLLVQAQPLGLTTQQFAHHQARAASARACSGRIARWNCISRAISASLMGVSSTNRLHGAGCPSERGPCCAASSW